MEKNGKVLLVMVDGMRPDSLTESGEGFLQSLLPQSTFSLDARSVMPSLTLPCHASIFYGVSPERHGITDNTWHPFARPLEGVYETVHSAGKKTAAFIVWEHLRDLGRPGSLDHMEFTRMTKPYTNMIEQEARLAKAAASYIQEEEPDFVFFYIGSTDECGHRCGWMSPEYLGCISAAQTCLRKLAASLPKQYSIIVTADHGGHGLHHGSDDILDMRVPMLYYGPAFEKGVEITNASILDIAPTVAAVLGLEANEEWVGVSRKKQ